jgi:hypothetical protein
LGLARRGGGGGGRSPIFYPGLRWGSSVAEGSGPAAAVVLWLTWSDMLLAGFRLMATATTGGQRENGWSELAPHCAYPGGGLEEPAEHSLVRIQQGRIEKETLRLLYLLERFLCFSYEKEYSKICHLLKNQKKCQIHISFEKIVFI